jgi:hypothetical protein
MSRDPHLLLICRGIWMSSEVHPPKATRRLEDPKWSGERGSNPRPQLWEVSPRGRGYFPIFGVFRPVNSPKSPSRADASDASTVSELTGSESVRQGFKITRFPAAACRLSSHSVGLDALGVLSRAAVHRRRTSRSTACRSLPARRVTEWLPVDRPARAPLTTP